MTRPKWVNSLYQYVTDTLVMDESLEFPEDGSDDLLLDDITDAVNFVLCGHYGHEIVDDQCGIPAHRFCVYCQKRESDCLGEDDEAISEAGG